MRALLLISDRADQSCELAARISTLCRCLAIGLHEDTNIVLRAATAIVIDVALTDGLVIGRVQYLLSRYRAPTAPVVAILRADTHPRASSSGRSWRNHHFPADVSVKEIAAALAPIIGRVMP